MRGGRRYFERASGQGRAPGGLIAGAVALALAGVVAGAANGSPAWTSLRDGRGNRGEILADVAVLAVVGVIAAFAVTLIIHHAFIKQRAGAPPLRRTLLRALPITTVALSVLALLVIARTDLDDASGDAAARILDPVGDRPASLWGIIDRRDSPVKAGDGKPETDEHGGGGADPGGVSTYLLIVLGAVAMAILGVVARTWYTSRSANRERQLDGEDRDPNRGHAAAREAVEGTIDSMLADPDPNTAIIGAYARLLEGLAARGSGRREHEGPMEHLRRVLTRLQVRPEPLRQLIGLFETARFSTHPLTSGHREQALDALRGVASDLAAASASSPDTAGARPVGASR